MFVYLFVCLLVYLFVYLFTYLFIHLFVYSFVCLFVCLFIRLSVYLFVCFVCFLGKFRILGSGIRTLLGKRRIRLCFRTFKVYHESILKEGLVSFGVVLPD